MWKKIVIYEMIGFMLFMTLKWTNAFQFSLYVDGMLFGVYFLLPIVLFRSQDEEDNNSLFWNIIVDIFFVVALFVCVLSNVSQERMIKKGVLLVLLSAFYVIVRFVVSKFVPHAHDIMWVTLSVLGVVIILFSQITISRKDIIEKEEIYLDKATYIKCKELSENEFVNAFVILDQSDTSLYLRDVASDSTTFLAFDTSEEKNAFEQENTIGQVSIPVLSGDVQFDDLDNRITYQPRITRESEQNCFERLIPFATIAIEIWCLFIACMGAIYESLKKKKNI